jgi:hypothetical protein
MRYHRRTAPKVIDGKVQRQNNWRFSEVDYTATHQIKIERYKPRPGYRHLVSPTDVSAFLALLPDWRELSIGLQRVILDDDVSCFGWHRPTTIAVCAWPAGLDYVFTPDFFHAHSTIFRRMGISCRPVVLPERATCPKCFDALESTDWEVCRFCKGSLADAYRDADTDAPNLRYLGAFTETSAQAFLLVHVLVHELGHHHDRMTSPSRRDCTRGEPYAEEYARRYEDRIWPAYCRVFRPRGERRRR